MKAKGKLPGRLNGADKVMMGMTVALFIMCLARVFYADWDDDDWEHLASAWFIFNGYVPFRDFFEHHNPLWWYMLAPLFHFVEKPYHVFWPASVITAAFAVGSMGWLWGIVKQLGYGLRVRTGVMFVYLSYPIAALRYIQNRPDTPMLFFLIGGVYYWILFCKQKNDRVLIISYLFFVIAFLFFQKALIFLGPFGLYQLYLLCRKRLGWRSLLKAMVLPILLMSGFVGYLVATGTLQRYWETNYVLNAVVYRNFRMYSFFVHDWIYLILGIVALVGAMIKTTDWKRELAVVCIGSALVWGVLPKPYSYYYFMWIPMAAVPIGIFMASWKDGARLVLAIPVFLFMLMAFAVGRWWTPMSFDETQKFYAKLKPGDDVLICGCPWTLPFVRLGPEHYYWNFLFDISRLDDEMFHYSELPDCNEQMYREKPRFVRRVIIPDARHTAPHEAKEVWMQTDQEFLEKHYTQIPTELLMWERKD